MLRKIAIGCSIIGHPVFLFTFIFLFVWIADYPFLYIPDSGAPYILTFIILNTIILPIALTYLINGEVWLGKREKRFFPIMGTLIFYMATWYYLKIVAFPFVITLFLLCLAIGLAVLLVLNFKWKISIHTTALGAGLGFFIFLFLTESTFGIWPLAALIIFSGLVGTARLYLDAHHPEQVYVGYAIGLILTLIVFGW